MTHNLKTLPQYFQSAWTGRKTFEIRNNDRNFQMDDEIVLEEFNRNEDDYTGRSIEGFITYITSFEQKDGYVIFSYQETGRTE